jgi:hypothetical protein
MITIIIIIYFYYYYILLYIIIIIYYYLPIYIYTVYIYYNLKQTDRPSGTQSRDAGKPALPWSLKR